ncbi:probable carboxylesterase 16 [Elaeis guineensis]|uniref:Probable carboxylesterase 11 n=1 Tax=Elaeis guineensis var. tenera TaxID=51953 RepID=A0A6I9S2J7_ELAGV|nr:probable carboxylesterase 11 [Elaeis guineensis]
MPSVAVKLYSVFFKLLLKHRLHGWIDGGAAAATATAGHFGITSRPEESMAPANPSFGPDGVATKDIHIDPLTSLSLRIFLPDSSLPRPKPHPAVRSLDPPRRNSCGGNAAPANDRAARRSSFDAPRSAAENGVGGGSYRGYLPSVAGDGRHRSGGSRKLPVILQFHGGGFIAGSNTCAANDVFCRRIAKLCDVIVIAVGYRLAPENRYPAAFEDGLEVLNWLGKQANLAECSKSLGDVKGGGDGDSKRADIVDTFGASTVEPWLAAHADPSRCVLLGVSCGANIADFVARKAVEAGKLIEPVKVVAQVLMYPFFIGSVPTHSEIKLANSYFYDKSMCVLAWRLFLPEAEYSLDHPAANPLVPGRGPPLKCMPPTLTVVAEHDWMRDRAIAYSEELRKVNVDAPVLEYKDAVHEFATLDMLLKTPQAQACAEDIAIWVKKYISIRGHEFSY